MAILKLKAPCFNSCITLREECSLSSSFFLPLLVLKTKIIEFYQVIYFFLDSIGAYLNFKEEMRHYDYLSK